MSFTHPALKGENLNRFFFETHERLKSHGVEISEKESLAIFHRMMEGVRFLDSRFHQWWKLCEAGEIDVGDFEKSPYGIVVSKFGLELGALPDEEIRECGFAPSSGSADEWRILNEFWNSAVAALQGAATSGVS